MWDWIVEILFQTLKLIQGFAGDWGLSIIILVVIIRLLLTPLMLKSTKSTARMQVLQPKMMEMQERYADDPERLSREMQKFYAENKFNPLAGCLPLLIQMPILIALFNLLRDLGKYFPEAAETGFSFYNVLPNLVMSPSQAMSFGIGSALPYMLALILFGLLTFIPQMYMTRNQTGAQAESTKMMMIVMTVMMLFMGWGLPAGVLLYYDVSSAWQVTQQLFVTNKVIEKAKAEEEARLANAPLEVDVVRRERKQRPHKKH
ncbi:YidC/Oxa1 family membrane protein insertase [Collinsella provencensis]|uniref:YidC/Oxa1 family membrane protein insertase n=1 Tax=Collinsella provencensis TaxID=1937461 RepID=UPI000C85827B|nr:YidC/Oxa1 family membrane protein insertase [Collinsella provencensis]